MRDVAVITADNVDKDALKKLFDEYDHDADGKLSVGEVERMLVHVSSSTA